MRTFFSKSSLGGLILAALAAGVCTLPAFAAKHRRQSDAAPTQKKAGSSSAHSTKSSGSAGKKTASSGAGTSANGSATKKPVSSARSKGRRRTTRVKGQQAPTADRINEIQQALASKGVLTGDPTGKWDNSTIDAMKKFQASQGLSPSGKLDALTLQKLGLGSQTAGVAAPTPPPNSINRLKNAPSAFEEPSSADEPHN